MCVDSVWCLPPVSCAMTSHLTPTDVVERLIGGFDIIASIVGRDEKSMFNWRRASGLREAGDIPGTPLMRKLLNHARENGIPLTAEHLIFGASEAEIAALTAQPQVAAE